MILFHAQFIQTPFRHLFRPQIQYLRPCLEVGVHEHNIAAAYPQHNRVHAPEFPHTSTKQPTLPSLFPIDALNSFHNPCDALHSTLQPRKPPDAQHKTSDIWIRCVAIHSITVTHSSYLPHQDDKLSADSSILHATQVRPSTRRHRVSTQRKRVPS